METAIALIWQSNYSNVGVAEICKQAGVTKGGFYHHFDTKAELFYEASMYYWESFKKDFDELFSPSFEPLEQLENLISYMLNKEGTHPDSPDNNPVAGCPFFTSGGQAGSGEEKVRLAAVELSGKAMKYTTALVRSLKADGKLEGNEDPEQLARIMYQYIQGVLLYGRVMRSLEAVKIDLRIALYRLLNVKKEFRIEGPELKENQEAA